MIPKTISIFIVANFRCPYKRIAAKPVPVFMKNFFKFKLPKRKKTVRNVSSFLPFVTYFLPENLFSLRLKSILSRTFIWASGLFSSLLD